MPKRKRPGEPGRVGVFFWVIGDRVFNRLNR